MPKKNVEFLGVYDEAYPRDHFIQHIPEMIHVPMTGNTFGDMVKAIETKYKESEELYPLFEDFIKFNREEGGAEDTDKILDGSSEERSVLHFSLYSVKE